MTITCQRCGNVFVFDGQWAQWLYPESRVYAICQVPNCKHRNLAQWKPDEQAEELLKEL